MCCYVVCVKLSQMKNDGSNHQQCSSKISLLFNKVHTKKKSHTHKQCSDKVAFYALCVDIMCRHYVYTLNSLNEWSDIRKKNLPI